MRICSRFLTCVVFALCVVGQTQAGEPANDVSGAKTGKIDWSPEQTDQWHGFKRHLFKVDGCKCWVVEPAKPRPGNDWVWCTEWPDAFTDRTGAEKLLADGFYYLHVEVGVLCFGSPAALAQMDAFYRHIVTKGLNAKGTLTGVSRGGLYAYRFAAAHPERVVCIYGDAPVCDFKSWPLGTVKGHRDEKNIKVLLNLYHFKNEAEALAYKGNPIDILKPLAKAGIPLIHVIGDADTTVPPESNSNLLEKRYKALGGAITVFHKPTCGHHPHGLDDPTPVVKLIEKYTARAEKQKSL